MNLLAPCRLRARVATNNKKFQEMVLTVILLTAFFICLHNVVFGFF